MGGCIRINNNIKSSASDSSDVSKASSLDHSESLSSYSISDITLPILL